MRLAIETATRHAVVALGGSSGVIASVVREVRPGRGTPLLTIIDEVLEAAVTSMDDVEAIGVGTGPGSFTGLRAGMATAKTLCWLRHLPLVALPTDLTMRRAAALADAGLRAPAALVLPAGARDHYLARPDADPELVPPSVDLAAILDGTPVVALDLASDGIAPDLARRAAGHGQPDPVELGTAALARAAQVMLVIMDERLAAGATEDPATLVPRYVALPRGIAAIPADSGTVVTDTTRREAAWSPTRP
jgi:tRNA threonylcarbamoyl adenosine modification protein YeaZ